MNEATIKKVAPTVDGNGRSVILHYNEYISFYLDETGNPIIDQTEAS